MGVTKYRFDLATGSGNTASAVAHHVQGSIVQVSYKGEDTGVALDTGAVITITQDTGEFSIPVAVMHAGNGPWSRAVQNALYDTGGTIVDGSQHPPVFWGEKMTVSVQGISTDTGKLGTVRVYTFSG